VFQSDKKPWYQLRGESDDAYSAFCLFSNMGHQRSLTKLATMINKWTTIELLPSAEQLNLWAKSFSWTKRVELCEQFIHDELLSGRAHLQGDCTLQ
jgi:hypothetical protein